MWNSAGEEIAVKRAEAGSVCETQLLRLFQF